MTLRKLTKAVSYLLVCVILLSLYSPAVNAATSFPDVSGKHWAASSIDRWANAELIMGYTDGTFRPNAPMTRAEFAAVVARLLGLTERSQNCFADLNMHSWYANAILRCAKAGVMKGDGKNCHPNSYITCEEAYTMLARTLQLEAGTKEDLSRFSDTAKISKWAVASTAALVNNGALVGDENRALNPQGTISRAQVVTILNRLVYAWINENGRISISSNASLETSSIVVTEARNYPVHITVTDGEDGSAVHLVTDVDQADITLDNTQPPMIIGAQEAITLPPEQDLTLDVNKRIEPEIQDRSYPMTYKDGTTSITIYREWYEDAWCYIAHLQFTDYTRFGTACANGKYDNGFETTSHAANRLGAIFATNGCYSAPYLEYGVIRSGVVCNDKKYGYVAGYSTESGLFGDLVKDKYNGPSLTELARDKIVTDTFCFGPEFLYDGEITVSKDNTSRAQRTSVGTNGQPGDLWIVVSEGRYADGSSPGLTFYQCAKLLKEKDCVYGIPLDGGGSSTMYFNGKVLNSVRGAERAVVDFLYFIK